MKRQNIKNIIIIGFSLIIMALIGCNATENLKSDSDEELLQRKDTPYDIAVAFATALRLNDPVVYELAEPSLHPRLDEWFKLHRVRKCSRPFDEGLIDGVRDPRFSISYGCFLENNQGSYIFKVGDIIISNRKIVQDWGEVSEKGGGG